MVTIEKSNEILKSLDTFYKAILPSEKYQYRKNMQIMATSEDSFYKNVSKPFLDYMRLKIIQDTRRAVIKAKTTPTIFTEYVDWEDISTKGKQLSKPAYVKILEKSGNQAAIVARVEAGFDVMNVNSIRWAEKYSAEMVTQVTGETKKALREIISDGMKQKWNKLKIARQINKLPIGLNLKQTQALHTFRDKLITDGASAKLVEKRIQSYYNRLLRQRSRSIARTETSRAVNEGYLQGLEQQKVYNYVKISMAADACHLCTEHEGRLFTLAEAHAFLPIHPHCRCAWVAVWSKKPGTMMPPLGLSSANAEQLKRENEQYRMMFDSSNKIEPAEMTKGRIAKELAEELEKNKDFLKYVAKEKGYAYHTTVDLDEVQKMISDLIRNWHGTSGDENTLAIAMQMATKTEFKLSKSVLSHFGADDIKAATAMLREDGKALQAFVRAQYNLTQEYFKKQGVTHLTSYRGVRLAEKVPGFQFGDDISMKVGKIQLQPMSSFSTDLGQATKFAAYDPYYDYRMIMQSKIPVNRIMATPQTGFGCKFESELVTLGGQESVKVMTLAGKFPDRWDDIQNYYKLFADFKVVPK